MSGGGARPLTCDGWCKGENPVTHIGSKGYAYCTPCGLDRRAGGHESTRAMKVWELAELTAGRTIRYEPGPKPTPLPPLADDASPSWGEVAERDAAGLCPSSPGYAEPHIPDGDNCAECGADVRPEPTASLIATDPCPWHGEGCPTWYGIHNDPPPHECVETFDGQCETCGCNPRFDGADAPSAITSKEV